MHKRRGRPVRSPSSGRQQVWRRTGRPAQGCELGATARDTRPLAAPGTPVCEPHESTGEPGAGNRPAGFGERGEETCLRDSDCGPARKRRMSHRTLPVTRLSSTLLMPARLARRRVVRARKLPKNEANPATVPTMRLEDLRPNSAVRGVHPDGLVTVVRTQWFCSEALELTYKTPAGTVANELRRRRRAVPAGVRGPAHPPRAPVGPAAGGPQAVVDPLPHQITGVYEAMLPRHPLRFLLADDPGAGKTPTGVGLRPGCESTG